MEYYDNKLTHLWVDIFILDELPDRDWEAGIVRFLHKAIYGMAMGHRYHLDMSRYRGAEKLMISCLSFVGRAVPMKWLNKFQEKLAVMWDGKKCRRFYYSNYQPDFLYVTVDRERDVYKRQILDRLFPTCLMCGTLKSFLWQIFLPEFP